MTSGAPAAMPARNGCRSASSWARERWTVADPKSVLTVAPPSPGKCLSVGATPPARQPPTAAVTSRRGRGGIASRTGAPAIAAPLIGTSATGASETLTPWESSERAAARASAPALCAAPWAGCERSGGAHGRMRIVAALLVDADDRLQRAAGAAQRPGQRRQLLRAGRRCRGRGSRRPPAASAIACVT